MVLPMVVFSNNRLGPSAELLVSDHVAIAMLRATAATARPFAEARWEHELVDWLERRASPTTATATSRLDVNDIAWTPDHFDSQRRFLVDAIIRAALGSEHVSAFDRWRRLIEAHPRDSVQVGRRWQWEVTA
jgi:hypothetical protein